MYFAYLKDGNGERDIFHSPVHSPSDCRSRSSGSGWSQQPGVPSGFAMCMGSKDLSNILPSPWVCYQCYQLAGSDAEQPGLRSALWYRTLTLWLNKLCYSTGPDLIFIFLKKKGGSISTVLMPVPGVPSWLCHLLVLYSWLNCFAFLKRCLLFCRKDDTPYWWL